MAAFDPTRADERASALVDRELKGTGLTFSLVMWLPGRAGERSCVAVNNPPGTRDEVLTALRTAVAALEARDA